VTILDVNLPRLQHLDEILPANVSTLFSTPTAIRSAARQADLLIGAVLVTGAPAPKLISRQLLTEMKAGAALVDVCIDQGGCAETSRPTKHSAPTYVEEGVVHYCVTNMPGAVGRTSTFALTNATLKYARCLADLGPARAVAERADLAAGVNMACGVMTHPAVAAAYKQPCHDPRKVLT
jgi:alanine dehydrogenase